LKTRPSKNVMKEVPNPKKIMKKQVVRGKSRLILKI
jgi:hypothetical protein